MNLTWTETQRNRLVELGAAPDQLQFDFLDSTARNRRFQDLARTLVDEQKQRLATLREGPRRPALRRLESDLVQALTGAGFVEVVTPVIMSRVHLEHMSVLSDHPLHKQIYWIDPTRCLRPMLAPHLYSLVKDLLRMWPKPVRIFEVGPCFRKESDGARHSAEFTMLNLCEFGLPEGDRAARLKALASLVTAAAGVDQGQLVEEESVVYGSTLDVVDPRSGLELGSGAMGPHPLDQAWGIADTWVGIGFGLERLLMAASGGESLARFGRSLAYQDGARLNL